MMSRRLFWSSDEAWPAIELHLSKNQPRVRRVDDRRVAASLPDAPDNVCTFRPCHFACQTQQAPECRIIILC